MKDREPLSEVTVPLKEKYTPMVAEYLDGITKLGLVGQVIVGVDGEDCEAHVFNVFKKDTKPEDAIDPK